VTAGSAFLRHWHTPAQVSKPEGALWAVAVVLLTLASLVPIWAVEYLPLQDYPYHLLRIQIIAEHANPVFDYGRYFDISLFPLPYVLLDYLILLLAPVFGLPLAGKLVLSIYVLGFVSSIFYFVRAFGPQYTLLGFFGFLFIYNWYFNMGFVNFALAIPFFFFAVGFYWRYRDALTLSRSLLLCGMVLLTYLTHLYVFLYLGVALGVIALLSQSKLRALMVLAGVSLPALLLLAATIVMHMPNYLGDGGSSVVFIDYPSLLWTLDAAIGSKLRYFASISPARERQVLVAAAAVWFALAAWNPSGLARNRFLVVVGSFCILYLALPEFVSPRYNFFACRVLIFIALLALALPVVPRVPAWRLLVLVALAVLALASLAVTTRAYLRADEKLRDYAAVLEQIPPGEGVCFVQDKQVARVGSIRPFALFHAYYYLEHSGGGPVYDASSQTHSDSRYRAVRVGSVPMMPGFVGTLRTVHDSRIVDQPSAHRIERFFSRRAIDKGGGVLLLSGGQRNDVQTAAARNGFEPMLELGDAAIYQRREVPAAVAPQMDPSFCDDSAYLVLLQERTQTKPDFTRRFEHMFSRGNVHLLARERASAK
jgi:hypothetical protein